MTQKADFNAEEWSLVLEGPPIAALMVIAADRGGTIRESLSIGKAYAAELENQGSSELLDAIVRDRPTIDPKSFGSADQIPVLGPARLDGALNTVEQKATSVEVDDYRRFVYAVGERVARSHKEGGFLGIGGKEVSDAEREALAAIAATLDYTPPEAPAES